jgi:hypothetical protein
MLELQGLTRRSGEVAALEDLTFSSAIGQGPAAKHTT